ncbi:deoxyguanosinetriphosphate triphosphohydrolase [Halorhodospira halochloris]|uniref:deoxyguanosinetriphosphate triphosphohydrolase n=1 Tax=Halorhodospira halochloris TaxID=1052 RepID=UPI001EE78310|nr:deoxyguanosinetriphosphate triphosphohydrolase [Halorhodospira halochloris]MCG5549056.1 deoxyguanosinetriphosphate triphosphohydrolase [Halorhodospira halochloris]
MTGAVTTPFASPLPCAVSEQNSRGRRYSEPHPGHRNQFQRDRDRIIHSAAFRRLEYKTQVFVNHEGDLYRTRLTHTLEVGQISRTCAQALGLNVDLVEAIALAHDLGHTPFGHAGQDALAACMEGLGGFEHNIQSLRVVDELETRYAEFDGLNLTFESREGLLKRCSRDKAIQLGDVAARFIDGGQPTLEAQLVNVCDGIAYNSHDVDDGLRSGLISVAECRHNELLAPLFAEVESAYPQLNERRVIYEVVRRMINVQVEDLIAESRRRIHQAAPSSVEQVRKCDKPLIGFSADMARRHQLLKDFLFARLYRHYRVARMVNKMQRVVNEIFHLLLDEPDLMPDQPRRLAAHAAAKYGRRGHARAVSDYIAGMTDRFALEEHRRLFRPEELT